MLAVGVVCDSSSVIPLLYVVAPLKANPFRLLRVPYRLVRLYSEVDLPVAALYLGIVETESGSPRLSQDLIRDCNFDMQFLDLYVGVFAITSLGAHAAASLLYW